MNTAQEALLQDLTTLAEWTTYYRNAIDKFLEKIPDPEYVDRLDIYKPLSRLALDLGRLELDVKKQIRRMW